MHFYAMIPEDDHIVLEGAQVRERGEVVVKVDAVVPYEQIVADLRPAHQRLHEFLPRWILRQGCLAAAIDVAKHDGHVFAGDGQFGRLDGKQVGKGGYFLVRETVCNGVDKTQDGAGGAPFLFKHSQTERASAICVGAVILADADHVSVGVCFEKAVQLLADNLQNLRIAHAPLARAAGITLPIVIGIVFRMLFSVATCRKEPVASMNPVIGDEHLVGFFKMVPSLVQRVCPEQVVLALPVSEGRGDDCVNRLQHKLLMSWFTGFSVPPVVNPDLILQEFHGAIDQPFSMADNPHILFVDDQPIPIFADSLIFGLVQDDIPFPDGFCPLVGLGGRIADEEMCGNIQRLTFSSRAARMTCDETSRHLPLVNNPHLRRGRDRRQNGESR